MSKQSLDELLKLYDQFVTEEIIKFMKFLSDARQRIIDGHEKYGEDWKEKDNLEEIEFEKLDIFNYEILDRCQKEWQNKQP